MHRQGIHRTSKYGKRTMVVVFGCALLSACGEYDEYGADEASLSADISSSSALTDGASSSGRGYVVWTTTLDLPGLQGFSYTYKNQSNHLSSLAAGHNLIPSQWPGYEIIEVDYGDASPTSKADDYTFNFSIRQMPAGSVYCEMYGTKVTQGPALCTQPTGDYVRVIAGFRLGFGLKTDHHISGILVMPGQYRPATMYDASGNYSNTERLTFLLVPKASVRQQSYQCGTSTKKGETFNLALNNPVLTGFKMYFTTSDHHVKQVGVAVKTNGVVAQLSDWAGDDPFSWCVYYADLL